MVSGYMYVLKAQCQSDDWQKLIVVSPVMRIHLALGGAGGVGWGACLSGVPPLSDRCPPDEGIIGARLSRVSSRRNLADNVYTVSWPGCHVIRDIEN